MPRYQWGRLRFRKHRTFGSWGSIGFIAVTRVQGASFQALMAGEFATMAFADPPYNQRIADVQGRGKIKHGNFSHACGEMNETQFVAFLSEILGLAARHSLDGAIPLLLHGLAPPPGDA